MKNRKKSQQFWFLRLNYSSAFYDKSDGLSHDELRPVSPAQIAYKEHHQGDN